MRKLLLSLVLLALVTMGFAQTPTDGDYRTRKTGNWTATDVWQVRSGGDWINTITAPTALNNVYLQTGHTVTIDVAIVACKDLHWGHKGSSYGSIKTGSNVVEVNGKVRLYVITGSAVTAAAAGDGVFYSDQTNSTATNSAQFNGAGNSTLGYTKFVGNSRILTNTGEWNGSGTVAYGRFALNPGETATLETGMKFRGIVIESGIVDAGSNTLVVGSTEGAGDLEIKSGAKFMTSRSALALSQGSRRFGTLSIESGGALELSGRKPEINCSTFTNDGTVIYSCQDSTQHLAVTAGYVGVTPITSYNNLEIKVKADSTAKVPDGLDITVGGALTLTSGNLSIPATSSAELTNANIAVVGGSATSYIKTLVDGANSGVLKVSGLSTAQMFPVGSLEDYLPVSLTPLASSNFSINTFTGSTADGTPNGTSRSAGEKADEVNAIYNINRTSGTGNCILTLGWPAALEGTNFIDLLDAEIGVSKYTGTFGSYIGIGNILTNTVSTTIEDDVFGPFLIGKITPLPVNLISFTAKVSNQTAVLSWKTTSENNLSHYLVQRSSDGISFETLSSVSANNKAGIFNYGFVDRSPVFGANYYRLISVDIDGSKSSSDLQSVNFGSVISLSIYPNPTKGNINIAGLTKGDLVKITDLIGRAVAVKANEGESVMNLSLDGENTGVYLISVSRDGKVVSTNRLVKN